MKEDQNNHLQTLFAEVREDLDGEAFTAGMMAQTRFQRYRVPIMISGIALVVVVCAVLFAPSLLDFVLLITQVLTTTLIDLGEGWLAWIFSPINNIASLLILSGRALFVGWKLITRATYSN
jgi:hypothetical protein